MLAAGFMYLALTGVGFLLTFPDAFAEGQLVGGTQSSAWIYYLWHIGFCAFLIWSGSRLPRDLIDPQDQRRTLLVAGLIAVLAAATTVAIGIGASTWLPPLLEVMQPGPEALTPMHYPVAAAVFLTALAALAVTIWAFRLSRSKLRLWLTIVAGVFAADAVLHLSTDGRYSLGWYGPRLLTILSLLLIMGLLIRHEAVKNRQLSALLHSQRVEADHQRQQATRYRELSQIDELTGALTRRETFATLSRSLTQRSQSSPIGVLYVDSDGFKGVNDKFGHDVGDQVLRLLATTITEQVESHDAVGRLGGDEFLVIMAGHEPGSRVESLCSAICSAVSATEFGGEEEPIRLGVSIGGLIVDCPADVQTVVRDADHLMYRAKRSTDSHYEIGLLSASQQ